MPVANKTDRMTVRDIGGGFFRVSDRAAQSLAKAVGKRLPSLFAQEILVKEPLQGQSVWLAKTALAPKLGGPARGWVWAYAFAPRPEASRALRVRDGGSEIRARIDAAHKSANLARVLAKIVRKRQSELAGEVYRYQPAVARVRRDIRKICALWRKVVRLLFSASKISPDNAKVILSSIDAQSEGRRDLSFSLDTGHPLPIP